MNLAMHGESLSSPVDGDFFACVNKSYIVNLHFNVDVVLTLLLFVTAKIIICVCNNVYN